MVEQKLLHEYIDIYWKTFKNIDQLIGVPMIEYKISFEQFMIMCDLGEGKKLGVSEIARSRKVTRAAISRQIKTLLGLDYIIQERDSVDRRIQYLRLTEKGEEITELLNEKVSDRFYGWVDLLGQDDAHELLRIMRKVSDLIIAKETKE